ncbi:DUF302 domain-containing protein [Persephonella sp.]|nr:DUF302 domain-containing protein [Aquificota bacterium]
MVRIFLAVLFIFFGSQAYEDFVQYEKGYYYVEIKKGSFKAVNAKLLEEISSHGWDVIHTINVDKTVGMKKPYKTHLLCKSSYLKQGIERFKPIGIIIPCKMAIFSDGNSIKIMVEDVTEYGDLYGKGNPEFRKMLYRVKEEMIDILNKTAGKFMKSRYTPYE